MRTPEVREKIRSLALGRPSAFRGRTHTDEVRLRISAAKRGKQKTIRAAQLGGAGNAGKAKSPAHRAAIQRALRTSVKAAEQRARGCNLRGRTSIERAVAAVLDAMGIEYETQHRIGPYIADFYVPSYKQIIEVDGEYWHGKPEVKARDKRRDAELVAAGYNVVRVPGAAITRDARAALEAAWRL